MTQKILSAFIFLILFTLGTGNVFASASAVKAGVGTSPGGFRDQPAADYPGTGKQMPEFPAPKPQAPHGKAHVPQMEELPHVHKFHKERVRKIKKHHNKFWLLTKILLVLCHLSILLIAYLHATH